jgi:hypothetical protein
VLFDLLDIGAKFLVLGACLAQALHGGAQLCFGLAELAGQFGFPALQVGDRLVTGFLGVVKGAGKRLHFPQIGT